MHLLYSRFFCKALADLGVVAEREPFKRLFNQGQILGADGERMSKSRGNVQDPDELVSQVRRGRRAPVPDVHGPVGPGRPLEPERHRGRAPLPAARLDRVLGPAGSESSDANAGRLPEGQDLAAAEKALRQAAHRTLAGVTEDHEGFRWNTIVAKLMELTNTLMRYRGTEAAATAGWDEASRLLLLMLAPVAPHIADELWSRRLTAAGEPWRSIHTEAWPAVDPAQLVSDEIELPVQVNGKLRDLVKMAAGLSQAEIEAIVLAQPKVQANLGRQAGRQGHPRRRQAGQHRRPVVACRASVPGRPTRLMWSWATPEPVE